MVESRATTISKPRLWMAIFMRFFALGCVSFGGPAAHLGYFRRTFVQRLGWLDDAGYARWVALAQFLPGPASSQVGFAIGLQRGGLVGALLAFVGFTAPSFVLMTTLAIGSQLFLEASWLPAVVSGLKWLALVVVADAVIGLYQSFCRRPLTQAMALVSAAAVLVLPWVWSQPLVLLVMALMGARCLVIDAPQNRTESGSVSWWPLGVFAVLAACLLLPLTELDAVRPFFTAGSLVFGGGHVVLPLLQAGVGDAMPADRFLFGYASAQAMPGPLFTLAAFLGAELNPHQPWLGALLATGAIFVPGFLLLLALVNVWQRLATQPRWAGALAAVNAAVVGLLLAALYQPVFVSAIEDAQALALALLGLVALRLGRCPVLLLVALSIGLGLLGWV